MNTNLVCAPEPKAAEGCRSPKALPLQASGIVPRGFGLRQPSAAFGSATLSIVPRCFGLRRHDAALASRRAVEHLLEPVNALANPSCTKNGKTSSHSKPRAHLTYLTCLTLSLLTFFLTTACHAAPRPNVIFFLSDDQRADTIAALGNRHIRTPNLDRLVRRGTAFTQACYMGSISGAVCVPSRAMLMTGRTVFRATEPPSAGLIPKDLLMWPEVFRKAGYRTAGIGKWHNDTASYNRAFTTGGPIFFGGMANHTNVPVHDYDASGRYPQSRRRTGHRFSTELFADAAIEFLRENSRKPFVLYVAFTAPHDPRTPPTNSTAYALSEIPLPPNFLSDHPFDNGEMNVRDEQLLPRPRAPNAVRGELARYYGLITHMDAQIGRVLAALADAGQENNTIVVFAADNGLALGSHGLLGKQNLYEHSVRVPLVMAGPGIPQGRTSDALCYLHDLAPTLCELARLQPPATSEGLSLVPILKEPAAPGRPSIFCAYKDVQRSVRDDQWKLIWYPKLNKTQLFDLNADPHETSDLAANADNADVLARLRGALAAWQRKVNDPLKPGS